MGHFNLRVYGLLINDRNEILLSDEHRFGKKFTKFPGGGVDFGEGTRDALQREFFEEIGISVEIGELYYLVDFFQASAWDSEQQIVSAYYFVNYPSWRSIAIQTTKIYPEHDGEYNRWVKIKELTEDDLNLPIDKVVMKKLRAQSF
jgi:8-oxo-dGTP diphosphatase